MVLQENYSSPAAERLIWQGTFIGALYPEIHLDASLSTNEAWYHALVSHRA